MPKRGENIRKRKDGRWEGRYKDMSVQTANGKYVSVYGKTYSEVKEKLRNIIQKSPFQAIQLDKGCKFKEVLNMWMDANRLKHKGATETKYDYMIKKHILPDLGDFDVREIDQFVLSNYIERKLYEGRLDHNGGLSSTYVRSMIVIITSALNYAVNEQMRPPLKTSVCKPPAEKNDLQILSTQEQLALETYLMNETNQTKLGVLISLRSGMRIGEICALMWTDVDLHDQIIRIRNTISRVKNETGVGTTLIVDKPKTAASVRDVPIHSELLPILTRMKSQASSPFVVSNTKRFTPPRTYEYRFHRLLKECGVRQIHYHALRHTFATRCVEMGVDCKTLSEILGHANVSITLNTYVHPSMDMKRLQLEKLSLSE